MSEAAKVLEDPFATGLAGRKLGRYEVLARLAAGGMAGVYVARASGVAGFERLFALKVLHPHLAHEDEFISMFLDEARLAARIRHPNVVPTTDISDTPDAGYYLVMDYIEGDHLGALLQAAFKQQSRLPIPVTLRVVNDALSGLAAAHNVLDEHGRRLNLVHRDISPHNIMVSADGVARVTDFGVAKSEVRLSSTRQGQFKGKLAYMAPEHASSGEADQRSDLFAMAIILWECLTGRRLFKSENHAATLNKICLEPIPPPSSVDPALAPFDAVVMKGLARDPAERFQTAEEFADALEQVAASAGGMASHRAVAKIVQSYAAEKIARDKALIRESIARLSQDAANAGAEASGPTTSGVVPSAGPQLATGAVDPPADAEAPPAPRRTGMWIGLILIGFAVAVGLMLLRSQPESEQVRSSPLQGTPEPQVPSEAEATRPAPTQPAQADAEQAPAEASPEGTPDQQPGAEASNTDSEADEAPPEEPTDGREAAAKTAPRARPAHRATRPRADHTARPAAPAARPAPAAAPKPRPKPKPKPSRDEDLLLNPYR